MKNKVIYVGLVIMALFWGGSFTATKTALNELSPLGVVTLRFFFTLILTIPILIYHYAKCHRIDKKDYALVFFLAVLGMVLYFIFESVGLSFTEASKASLIISLLPMVTVYLAIKLLKETINLKQKIAILIAFFGAFLVITNLNFNMNIVLNDIIGASLVFVSVICVAFYGVLSKKIVHKYNPLFLLAHIIVISFFIFLLLFFIFERSFAPISTPTLISLLYLGLIAGLFCYWMYYIGIRKLGVSKVAVFDYLVPLFAVIIAFLILKETITFYTIIGGIIIVGSVYVFSKSK